MELTKIEILNRTQVRKGFVLLVGFIALRLAFVRLWLVPVYGQVEFHADMHSLMFLVAAFFTISVGLVYFGFTQWVRVDLKKWWFKHGKSRWDIAWGVGTLIVFMVLILLIAIATYTFLERFGFDEIIVKLKEFGMSSSASAGSFSFRSFLIELFMGVFFGFALASFTEETLFRGFLQPILAERFGPWRANFLQAGLFSLSHIGLAPIGWAHQSVILIFIFVSGLVFGWLKMKRGNLLAAGVLHGLLG